MPGKIEKSLFKHKYERKKTQISLGKHTISSVNLLYANYRKVPKFLDTRKLCCNLSKIQTKRPNLWVSRQKDANGIANSEDPDQTAPLGAV